MIRLKHYIMRYWYLMVLGIACILGQAAAELSLPGYMSSIVTNGIQTDGLNSVDSEVWSSTTYEALVTLADGVDRDVIKNSYTYVDVADDTIAKTYTKAGHVYVRDNDYDHDALVQALRQPLYGVFLLQEKGEVSLVTLMSEEERNALKTQINDEMSQLGDKELKLTFGQVLKHEYTELGVSTDAIRNRYILNAGIKMLVIAFIGAALSFIGAAFASLFGAKVARDIRLDLFKKVESFSDEEMDRFSTASLITRSTNDITQVQQVLIIFIRLICFAPVLGIGALIMAIRTSLSMTWIIALSILMLIGVLIVTMIIALPKFKIVQSLIDRLNLSMRENLSGLLVIRAFGNELAAERRFDVANKDLTHVNLFVNRVMVALMPVMQLIMNGVSLAIVYIGAKQVDQGVVAIGDIMAFLQYAMMIIMGFLMIGMMAIMLPRAAISANRIADVLETKATILNPETPVSFVAGEKGCIEFNHVTFHYPEADKPVLKDITFRANPGEVTAIIGSTGSGKSTLINLIPRFYDVSSGEVKVDGVDVRHVLLHDLRELIGLVPQISHLFGGTIRSNLSFGHEDITEDIINESIDIAQAREFVSLMPEGLEAPIAQGGTNVSGGQKQRLAIARALAKQPEILIFDDSFSALDFKTDATLRHELKDLCDSQKTTVILVGQRIATIMDAAQILVLDQGEIVGRGTHAELLKNCQVYQEIAYSQLSKEELSYE